MASERVLLCVPASPAYAAALRLTAVSLAGRDGFDYDQVEDLRIAVSEAVGVLLGIEPGTPDDTGSINVVDDRIPAPSRIDAEFLTEDATLRIRLRLCDTMAPGPIRSLSRQILDATTDGHDVALDAAGGSLIQLWKHREPRRP